MEKLLPCPFCAEVPKSPDVDPRLEKAFGVYVRLACVKCRANGPSASNTEDAVKLWNRRSLDSLLDSFAVKTAEWDGRRRVAQRLLSWAKGQKKGDYVLYDELVFFLGQLLVAPGEKNALAEIDNLEEESDA
jgi:hypothetical protein